MEFLDRMRTRAQERRCADFHAEQLAARKFAFVGSLPRTMGNVAGSSVHDYIDDMVATLFSKGGASNLTLSYSVATNALTIAAKGFGGSNADSDTPIVATMRSSTATSGDSNVRTITGASSLVVSSGSTLGHSNNDNRWVYVYLIENGSSGLELAVSSKLFGLQGIVSTTAEGGAGAADSATVMYSTTARTNTPFLCVGRFQAPQTAAGTWAAVPSSAEMWPFGSANQIDLGGDADGDVYYRAAGLLARLALGTAGQMLAVNAGATAPAWQSMATQSDQETATSVTAPVTPGRQQYHPSAAKGWVVAGVTGNILASYNVTSVADTGVGVATVSWNVDFSSANHTSNPSPIFDTTSAAAGTLAMATDNTNFLAGSGVYTCRRVSDGALTDPSGWSIVAFGDQ